MAMAERHSMVVLREARVSDAEEIATLAEALGYPSSVPEVRERLQILVDNACNHVIVAEMAGVGVVGWVHAYRVDLLEMDPFAEIGGLIVNEAYRGWGIGSRLIEAAQLWTRAGGMSNLRVRSRVERERAHRFYYGHGFLFRKSQVVLTKSVDLELSDAAGHPQQRDAGRRVF